MNTQQNTQGLLILMGPPSLEDMLVDMLLERPQFSGFTSSRVSGHGSSLAARLSLAEQVTGRQNRVQFMLQGELDQLHTLIAELKQKFDNSGLHYMLLPVIATGTI